MSLLELMLGKRKARVEASDTGHGSTSTEENLAMLLDASKTKTESNPVHMGTHTPFKKRLAWWIKNPPADTVTIACGPSEAEAIMEWNTRNRGTSKGTVRRYAEFMKRQAWRYTRVPVIFSNERLIDGQHRIQAIIESGAVVRLDLAFGADDDAFYDIDRGLKRTTGHIFSINGVGDYNVAAAATNIIVAYDRGSLGTALAKTGSSLRPEDLYIEYLKLASLPHSLTIGRLFQRNRGIASVSLMTAMHYVCSRFAKGQADEFFTKLATGESIRKSDPVYLLRKNLLEQSVSEKFTGAAIAAMTIKAWNATRDGKPAKLLRLSSNEKFPRAH